MAYSSVPKMRKDGKLTLQDSGATNTLEVEYEDGNFTFSVSKRQAVILRDRGTITTARSGDQDPVATGSFTIHLRQFTDASTAGSVLDFVNKTGHYNGNTTTGTAGTPYVEEYCIDIKYEVEGTDLGDAKDHSATLTKCVCTVSITEGDPTALNIEFVSYGTLTYA